MRHASFDRQRVLLVLLVVAIGGQLGLGDNVKKGPSQKPAQGPSAKAKAQAQSNAKKKPAARVTRAREAAAMAFVGEHHPALQKLLVHLKKNRRRDYQKAIRELFHTSERLARVQERGDDVAYELHLRAWMVNSRIELLAAKLRVESVDDATVEKLRQDLRSALSEQADLQVKIVQHTRDGLLERVDRLTNQLERLEGNREERIERQFARWTKNRKKPSRGDTKAN